MMKKINILLLLVLVSVSGFSQKRAISLKAIEEAKNFTSELRLDTEWNYYNDFQDTTSLYSMNIDNLDSLLDHPDVSALTGLNFLPDAWMLLHHIDNPNIWAASNSYFETPGQVDRWLITPEITVSENAKLKWRSKSYRYYESSTTNETYEVYISNSDGSGYEDFINPPVLTISDEDTLWMDHEIDLSGFGGDSIYIAFRHISNNQGILGIDDIRIGTEIITPSGVFGDFEEYNDFTFDLSPWKNLDLDSSETYVIQGISFPHAGEAMPFIVFNPYSTSPNLPDADPHGGEKFGACFASIPVSQGGTGPNNDWLISPKVIVADNGWFKFWARSFTEVYGLERFKVGISTTDDSPESFTILSAGDYIEADTAWTEYSYDLSAYSNQEVFVAINCVSDNSFAFFVDDISVDTVGVQSIGVINNLEINIYPNPTSGLVKIDYSKEASVSVLNILGDEIMFFEDIQKLNNEIDLSSLINGVYVLRVRSNNIVKSLPVQIIK